MQPFALALLLAFLLPGPGDAGPVRRLGALVFQDNDRPREVSLRPLEVASIRLESPSTLLEVEVEPPSSTHPTKVARDWGRPLPTAVHLGPGFGRFSASDNGYLHLHFTVPKLFRGRASLPGDSDQRGALAETTKGLIFALTQAQARVADAKREQDPTPLEGNSVLETFLADFPEGTTLDLRFRGIQGVLRIFGGERAKDRALHFLESLARPGLPWSPIPGFHSPAFFSPGGLPPAFFHTGTLVGWVESSADWPRRELRRLAAHVIRPQPSPPSLSNEPALPKKASP